MLHAAAALVLAALLPPAGQAPLTVSAAVSLTAAMTEIAAAYERAGGAPVRLNFGASNVLARQIVNGAPVDVFVSADAAQMDAAAAAIVPGSRVDVVGNRLAVVAAPERVEAIRNAFPHAESGIRRLAIGDPAAVPAGVYARAWLERRGLWTAYQRRIVPTGSVRGALAAVQNGSADAAIVYVTDVRAARNAAVAIEVPAADAPRISYPAAIVASTRNRSAATRFLEFLRGAEARAIFARHGFPPPEVP